MPVVGADVGGQRELVTPECGVLIERGEEAEEARQYADILARLLSDPERCKALGRSGRQRIAQHFRLEQMTDRFLAAYQAARRERKPQPGRFRGLAWVGRVPARRSNTSAWRASPTGCGRNEGREQPRALFRSTPIRGGRACILPPSRLTAGLYRPAEGEPSVAALPEKSSQTALAARGHPMRGYLYRPDS